MAGKDTKTSLRFQKSLEGLHDLENDARIKRKRIDHSKAISAYNVLEHYVDGNLTIILGVPSERNGDVIRRLLSSCETVASRTNFSGFVLRLDSDNGRIEDYWNQKAMFISNVISVNGPDGRIPTVVRLYLVQDQPEKAGMDDIYFLLSKRSFKTISGGVNREFGKLANRRSTIRVMVSSQV
jgi:hypothetical protein